MQHQRRGAPVRPRSRGRTEADESPRSALTSKADTPRKGKTRAVKPKGRRPGKNKSPSARQRAAQEASEQHARAFERLSRPPRKTFHVQDLEVDTLRPLVDLAYWSTFTEVRRDAAAAFATLAMNEVNLPVLSEAGALGAVIALIGMNSDTCDTQIQKDAAMALSFLVRVDDVRSRFIKAPDGLRSVFHICQSPSAEVRRACVNIFLELARGPETKEALVASGGVKHLFKLAQTNDETTVRKAATVLKKLAAHPANHESICADEATVKCIISLLIDCPDLQIRRDMVSVVTSIASSDDRRDTLVERGILTPLLMHLDPQTSSLETITKVIHCLLVISASPNVLRALVDEGALENLSRVIFDELREIRAYRASRQQSLNSKRTARSVNVGVGVGAGLTSRTSTSMNLGLGVGIGIGSGKGPPKGSGAGGGPGTLVRRQSSRAQFLMAPSQTESKEAEGSAANGAGGPGQPRATATLVGSGAASKVRSMLDMEMDALRFGLMILLNVASDERLREDLVDRGVAERLFEDQVLECTADKRIPRLAAKVLASIAESASPQPRHAKLIDAGVLHPMRLFLRSKDFSVRTLALTLAARLTVSPVAKLEIGRHVEMLKQFVTFCNVFDEDVNADLATAISNMSDERATFPQLAKARALHSLLYMISPRSKNAVARRESVRALGNLSTDPDVKQELVSSGALGYLISLSKSGSGLTKMYALKTLASLQHDAAAIRIQMVFRGFRERRKVIFHTALDIDSAAPGADDVPFAAVVAGLAATAVPTSHDESESESESESDPQAFEKEEAPAAASPSTG